MTEGVYLIDRIRHKCSEDGGCLIWSGDASQQGQRPRIYLDGRRMSLRHAIWVEMNGEPKKGARVGVKCKTERCIEPEHLVARTRAAELKGIKRPLSTKVKIAAAKRAKSAYSDEFIEMVRNHPLGHIALAKELGMHYQTITRIRNYQMRRDYTNPFAGLGARA